MITVIIPTFNEEKHIEKLILSIAKFDSVSEIIVVDGMSKDKTALCVGEIKKYQGLNIDIKLVENKRRIQSNAINIGLRKSKNDIVIRLDAHSYIGDSVTNSVLTRIADYAKSSEYSHVGFRQRFSFENIFQAAIYMLSHTPFLSGFASYRYAVTECVTLKTAWLFALSKKKCHMMEMEESLKTSYIFLTTSMRIYLLDRWSSSC